MCAPQSGDLSGGDSAKCSLLKHCLINSSHCLAAAWRKTSAAPTFGPNVFGVELSIWRGSVLLAGSLPFSFYETSSGARSSAGLCYRAAFWWSQLGSRAMQLQRHLFWLNLIHHSIWARVQGNYRNYPMLIAEKELKVSLRCRTTGRSVTELRWCMLCIMWLALYFF